MAWTYSQGKRYRNTCRSMRCSPLTLALSEGIRHALSVRLINNAHRLNRMTGHVVRELSTRVQLTEGLTISFGAQEYGIRVVDVETGVVWFTKKRFKELYKLYRKVHFPTLRRTEISISYSHVSVSLAMPVVGTSQRLCLPSSSKPSCLGC